MSSLDPFSLLGVEAVFELDSRRLRAAWIQRAAEAHPDAHREHSVESHPDALHAVDASARINDAYRVLADPLSRAAALLVARGAPLGDDRSMPNELLVEIMELRECADDVAIDRTRRALLSTHARARRDEELQHLAQAFSSNGSTQLPMEAGVAQRVRTCMNVIRAFDRVLEQLEREEHMPTLPGDL